MKRGYLLFFLLLSIFYVIPFISSLTINGKVVTGEAINQPTTVSLFIRPKNLSITLLSPLNQTYYTSLVLLNYTTRNVSTVWYSLDGGANTSINSAIAFTLVVGGHYLIIYGNNSGKLTFDEVYFTISNETDPAELGSSSGGSSSSVSSSGGSSNEVIIKNVTIPEECKNNISPVQCTKELTFVEKETPYSNDCCLGNFCWFRFIFCWYYWVLIILLILVYLIGRYLRFKPRNHSNSEKITVIHGAQNGKFFEDKSSFSKNVCGDIINYYSEDKRQKISLNKVSSDSRGKLVPIKIDNSFKKDNYLNRLRKFYE